MKTVQNILIGIILGTAAGLWIGMNIGKDKPLLSNPFHEPTLAERAEWKARELYEDTKRSLEK
jgi:hypothetical protein